MDYKVMIHQCHNILNASLHLAHCLVSKKKSTTNPPPPQHQTDLSPDDEMWELPVLITPKDPVLKRQDPAPSSPNGAAEHQ